jgi:hypothetical protein
MIGFGFALFGALAGWEESHAVILSIQLGQRRADRGNEASIASLVRECDRSTDLP